MKTLKKKTLNAAVGAALGMAVAVPASADSLLAPLVAESAGQSSSPTRTFFQLKVEGSGAVNINWVGVPASNQSWLHYTYFKKGNTALAFYNLGKACNRRDFDGDTSPWDMVMQSAARRPGIRSQFPRRDQSTPGFVSRPFYGFAVLDDQVPDGTNGGRINVGFVAGGGVVLHKEGNFSGNAYVVNFSDNTTLDYKLLNNHKSARSGDFSVGFISKTSVDLTWWPTNFVDTEWLVLAVGADMTTDSTGQGNGLSWNGSVLLTQDPNIVPDGTIRPFDTGASKNGAYNNDESISSGSQDVTVTCMGLIDRRDFLTSGNQLRDTRRGGWTRRAILPVAPSLGAPIRATGAIVYRLEDSSGSPVLDGFQVETSGDVNSGGANGGEHPNKPY